MSQGSVLGPIIFNMYTISLSNLISLSSITHLLYAQDTQIFISFIPKNLSTAISDLESTIYLVSSWMSFNYLILNPSKTDFFSYWTNFHSKLLKSSTHHFPSLSRIPFLPLLPLGTSDSSLTRTYRFPNKFPSFLAPAITTYVTFVVSDTFDFTTAATIATSLVHSRLDDCNSL